MLQAEMLHFIGEMQAYCELEAIALAWQDFLKFAQAREGDLDSLIGEHRLYLKKLAARIFLLNPQNHEEVSICSALCIPGLANANYFRLHCSAWSRIVWSSF